MLDSLPTLGQRILLVLCLSLAFVCTPLLGHEAKAKAPALPPGSALFCWEWYEDEAEVDELFALMHSQGLDTVFQHVPADGRKAHVSHYLRRAAEEGIAVYLLDGQPKWAADPEGNAMREVIRRTAKYNELLDEDEVGFQGVLMDVEPHLSDNWPRKAQSIMRDYALGMEQARDTAQRRDLKLIACLPYDFDAYADAVAAIVLRGCDALAVMNYNRTDEIGQLRLESALCAQAEIPLYSICELQAPGEHKLEDINTYANAGLDALRKNANTLVAAYPDQTIRIALHYDKPLRDLVEAER